MNILHVEKLDIDLKAYAKRSALETDYTKFVDVDTLVCLDGEPVILYQKLDWDFEPLRAVVRGIEYQTTTRSGGLKTTSRVFGYQPRIALRRDFCAATTLQQREARKSKVIQEYGSRIADIYRTHFPTVFQQHLSWTESNVREEWKIRETPFTSGIINKNNPLKYHFDAGNIKGVCSCMLGLKSSVSGGFLSVPELGIGFEIADKSLLIFDGQSLLHGVTPIRKLSGNAYRYTIVYYALQQMWKCEPLTKELARIRSLKTQRERKRAGLVEEAELHVTQHGVEEGKADE